MFCTQTFSSTESKHVDETIVSWLGRESNKKSSETDTTLLLCKQSVLTRILGCLICTHQGFVCGSSSVSIRDAWSWNSSKVFEYICTRLIWGN